MSKMLDVRKTIATFSTPDGSVVVNLRVDDSMCLSATGFKDNARISFDERYPASVFRALGDLGKPASQK